MVSKSTLIFSVCCAFGIGTVGMLTVVSMSPGIPLIRMLLERSRSLVFTNNGTQLLPASSGSEIKEEEKRHSFPATSDSAISSGSASSDGSHSGAAHSKPLLFVAYLSAPANIGRREAVRKHCIPRIRAAGFDVKFFIGRPNEEVGFISKGQGQRSTAMETRLALSLQNESDWFGDIVISPFRDAYRDLTDKVVFLFRYALQSGAQNILKIDDDWCPNMQHIVKAIRATTLSKARYIGQYLWNGNEYEIMKGRDGSVHKFMTGVGFILSSSLARKMFYDDLVHSLLFAPYGTSSDDANVGRWYDYAAEKHPELKFTREVVPDLVVPVPK